MDWFSSSSSRQRLTFPTFKLQSHVPSCHRSTFNRRRLGVAAQGGRLLSLRPQEILTGQEQLARAALEGQQAVLRQPSSQTPSALALDDSVLRAVQAARGKGPHLPSFCFLPAARGGRVSANSGVSSLPSQLCQVNWTKCQFIDHSLKNVGHVN